MTRQGETHAVRRVAGEGVLGSRSKVDLKDLRPIQLVRDATRGAARALEWRRGGEDEGEAEERSSLWKTPRKMMRFLFSEPTVLPHLRLFSSTPSARSISTAMSRTSGTTTEFPSS